jgi:hypothetical protein
MPIQGFFVFLRPGFRHLGYESSLEWFLQSCGMLLCGKPEDRVETLIKDELDSADAR